MEEKHKGRQSCVHFEWLSRPVRGKSLSECTGFPISLTVCLANHWFSSKPIQAFSTFSLPPLFFNMLTVHQCWPSAFTSVGVLEPFRCICFCLLVCFIHFSAGIVLQSKLPSMSNVWEMPLPYVANRMKRNSYLLLLLWILWYIHVLMSDCIHVIYMEKN